MMLNRLSEEMEEEETPEDIRQRIEHLKGMVGLRVLTSP